MRARFPLPARILLGIFVNVVLIIGLLVLILTAQFRFDLDWVFASGARERIEAVRDLVIGELSVTPPHDWEDVLERFSNAYGVRFGLFDPDGDMLVGGLGNLPREVRERIAPEDARWRRRGPIRALMRTTDPVRYWLITSARVDNPRLGDPMRVILVARSASISGNGLIFDLRPWVGLALGALILSLLLWLPLLRGITRSVARMKDVTRQIADGQFQVRINSSRRDELGELGDSIDQMAARLDGFVQGQKRFLGDIAHELCSPLARLQMALGILEERADPAQSKYARAASEKAEQIANLVSELLSFSKASFSGVAIQLQPVNVREAAEEAVRREVPEGAALEMDIPDELQVQADRDLLVRVLSNLLRNALQHGGASVPIRISARRQGSEATIVVADEGPGVPEAELSRIFDAFYRLDHSRARDTGGTGLGLMIVKTCMESCCGTVTARNRQPHGLEIRLQLAAADPAAKVPEITRAAST